MASGQRHEPDDPTRAIAHPPGPATSRRDATLAVSRNSAAATETAPAAKLLKRRDAARVLGVSESTIRRMEGSTLTPVLGADGIHRFHADEVRELTVRQVEMGPEDPSAYDGAIAAQVFRLLDLGHHPIDVVKETELDPRVVNALHREYARMRGGFVLTARDVQEIEDLVWLEGSFPMQRAEDLLENLRGSEPTSCAHCRRGHAVICARCTSRMAVAQANEHLRASTERSQAVSSAKRRSRMDRDELYPSEVRRSTERSKSCSDETQSSPPTTEDGDPGDTGDAAPE